jgi:hypothetical protein
MLPKRFFSRFFYCYDEKMCMLTYDNVVRTLLGMLFSFSSAQNNKLHLIICSIRKYFSLFSLVYYSEFGQCYPLGSLRQINYPRFE